MVDSLHCMFQYYRKKTHSSWKRKEGRKITRIKQQWRPAERPALIAPSALAVSDDLIAPPSPSPQYQPQS